jgi:hypothetical protein
MSLRSVDPFRRAAAAESRALGRPDLFAVKFLTWTEDDPLRQVVD